MSSRISTESSASPASESGAESGAESGRREPSGSSEAALAEYLDARASYKARCNEEWFKDAQGLAHENNWHHEEWFRLAEHHTRLLNEAAREHSKTHVYATAQPLIEMALNPNVRILIISDVFDKSQERTRVLREHIANNAEYRKAAPHVRVVRQKGDEAFWLEREHYWLKEPTVRSTYAGAAISGGRYEIVIADDLVNFLMNANTPQKRQRLSRWWFDEVENSVVRGGVIWVVGTHQHPDDLYEELKRQPAYHVAIYPAVDEEDTGYGHLNYAEKNPGFSGLDATVLWPKAFSYAQHMAKKTNPSTHDSYLRQQQQLAVPESGLVYRKPLMDAAFERGKSVTYNEEAAQFLGVDPGYGIRASMLCVQERAGDRIDLWREHSFTQMRDEEIARVVCEHAETYGLEAVFIDAEDPGLAAQIRAERDTRALTFKVVGVAFAKFKRLAVKTTRWMLEGQRVSWGGETIVHTPGRIATEPSLFRREVSVLALDPNDEDMPAKGSDHGPDAWVAFAARHIQHWIRATGQEG